MTISPIQPGSNRAVAEPPSVKNVIVQIALNCLKELVVSLAFCAVVTSFIPIAIGTEAIVSAVVVQVVVSLFFHSLGAYASYKIAKNEEGALVSFKSIRSLCEFMTGVNFAVMTGVNAQALIHETGHAIASLAVYANPRPQIQIFPFNGGFTQYFKTNLSPFGKKIGPVAGTCLVIASGPAFTLLISSILFVIGFAIKKQYPQFGKYLITWGLVDFLYHARYAYSALRSNPSNLRHDFVHLAIFGLNPVTATIGILAIPVVLGLGMMWRESRQPQEMQLATV